jgi:hypothetical protein
VRQTSPSKRPPAQVAFAKKAADAKAAKGKTSPIAPDLIDGNEQELASRRSLRSARISSPRIGCTLGMPFLTR